MVVENRIPIAIADDHSVVRKGLIDFIDSWGDFTVVLEAGNGMVLLKNLEKAEQFPELCILDMNMPVMNGYETYKEIKKRWPAFKVLILSVSISEYTAINMINLGANGFLSKGCDPEDIHKALWSIYENGYYYSQLISKKIFDKAKNKSLLKITCRETEFMNLCCTDMGYKTIADRMGISIRTIESYRDSLYKKLNVKTRMGLMIFALKNGIVQQDNFT
jgi:two-component system invasion response regulator UvrY